MEDTIEQQFITAMELDKEFELFKTANTEAEAYEHLIESANNN